MATPEEVEIKINLSAEQVDDGRERFDLPAKKAQSADIWFCEERHRAAPVSGLRLLSAGLILRLRRKKDDEDDSTAKLRGAAPIRLPRGWDHDDGRSKTKFEGD